jgi:hypothetical protein
VAELSATAGAPVPETVMIETNEGLSRQAIVCVASL